MIAETWRLIADGSGSGRARRFLRVWAWYERLDTWLRPNLPIPGAPTDVFRVTFVRHRGRPITLPDGTHVRRGDDLCQLHITNARLAAVTSRGVWRAQGAMEGDLRALAAAFERAVQSGRLPAEIGAGR